MAVSPALVVAGAAALLGGAYLWRRRQEAAAKPDGGGGLPCEKLDAYPVAAAYCRGADAVWEGLGWIQNEFSYERKNRELNGDIKRTVDPALFEQGWIEKPYTGSDHQGGPAAYNTFGSAPGGTLEYANGCTPYKGSPGWAKCVEGTTSWCNDSGFGNWGTWCSGLESGRQYDPTTRKHRSAGEMKDSARSKSGQYKPFPIPIPAGHTAWWVAGKPVTCPAGTEVALDGRPYAVPRSGPASPCVPIESDEPWDGTPPQRPPIRRDPPISTTTGTGTPTAPPPGYVWVPATSTTPGHYERPRAGAAR